jgi:hypothetical protein
MEDMPLCPFLLTNHVTLHKSHIYGGHTFRQFHWKKVSYFLRDEHSGNTYLACRCVTWVTHLMCHIGFLLAQMITSATTEEISGTSICTWQSRHSVGAHFFPPSTSPIPFLPTFYYPSSAHSWWGICTIVSVDLFTDTSKALMAVLNNNSINSSWVSNPVDTGCWLINSFEIRPPPTSFLQDLSISLFELLVFSLEQVIAFL